MGIADGAKGNWDFLSRHTDVRVTGFWHAAEYLGQAAVVLHLGHPHAREEWLDDARHRLKHDEDATRAIRAAANEPLGSGVTDAACKAIVKQRPCGSGMKWTEDGAAAVLSLRSLGYTPERWDRSWSNVDRWGFPAAV